MEALTVMMIGEKTLKNSWHVLLRGLGRSGYAVGVDAMVLGVVEKGLRPVQRPKKTVNSRYFRKLLHWNPVDHKSNPTENLDAIAPRVFGNFRPRSSPHYHDDFFDPCR